MTTSVLAVGSTVFITATVTYVTYYLFMMSRRPRIYSKSCHFMSHLMKACPMLSEKYVPPLWAVSGHVTTVARSMIQTKPPISYDRCVGYILHVHVHIVLSPNRTLPPLPH